MWQLNWRTIMIAIMISTPPTMVSVATHLTSSQLRETARDSILFNRERLAEIHLLVNSQRAELVARNDALLAEIIDLKEQLTWLRAERESQIP